MSDPAIRLPSHAPAHSTQPDYAADFFASGEVCYLNCAYQGPMPRVAIAAVEQSLALKRTPHLIKDEHHFSFANAYRNALSGLLGTAASNLAVTDSTTQGIMLAVGGLDWQPGDRVLIPRGTFPSNRFTWLSLVARGVEVIEVDSPIDADDVAMFEPHVNARTRVIAVGWVNYSNGRRRNLAALRRFTRERDILLVVDATQGLGGLELDLASADPDLLACSGYKWLLGPYGVGFAYIAPRFAEQLTVRNISWLAIVGAEDFSRLSDCDLELVADARRFDKNETASFFNLSGATAAVEYLRQVGPATVEAHVRGLHDRLLAGLPAGYRAVSPLAPGRRSNILCFAAATPEATRAAYQRITAANIVVSLREAAIRVSPHLYNTSGEIDRLLTLL